MTVRLAVRRKLRRGPHPGLKIEVEKFGQRASLLVSEMSHLTVLADVFLDDEYVVDGLDEPEQVLDLGSHIGISVMYFRMRYPRARIIAVEPDPASFCQLQRNVARLSGVDIHQLAVTDHGGSGALHRSRSSVESSLLSEQGDRVKVKTSSLNELLADCGIAGIDLLKIDIEGSEYAALKGFTHLDRVVAVVGEFHPDVLGDDLARLWTLLRGFNIERRRVNPDSIVFTALRRDGQTDT